MNAKVGFEHLNIDEEMKYETSLSRFELAKMEEVKQRPKPVYIDLPLSDQVKRIKKCVKYIFKPGTHFVTFSFWYYFLLNFFLFPIRFRIKRNHKGTYHKLQIPTQCLKTGLLNSKSLTTFMFLPKGCKQGQTPINFSAYQHILLFPGGAYLIGPYLYFTSTVKALTEKGFVVWVADYSKFTHRRAKHISLNSLQEAVSLYQYVHQLQQVPAHKIGFAGDSAGGDVILRMIKYFASIHQPVIGPTLLVSPAFLELCDPIELNEKGHNQDETLCTSCVLKLKKAMNHLSISEVMGKDVEEHFQGTGPVRLVVAQGEILETVARKLFDRLNDDQVTVELNVVKNVMHSFECYYTIDTFIEFRNRSIQWLLDQMNHLKR